MLKAREEFMPYTTEKDVFFMKMAFKMALQAQEQGEVPVGAVMVQENPSPSDKVFFKKNGPQAPFPGLSLVALACNRKETLKKATAHAEILAIEQASEHLKRWRLEDCTLYVTLEPCPMCAAALVAARVCRLVYGARDLKAGAVSSLYHITQDKRLNHQVEVSGGVLAKESSQILKKFFQSKRSSDLPPLKQKPGSGKIHRRL